MNYRALKNEWIEANPETEYTPGPNGAVLIPPANSKVYLHWLNDKGKLVNTYTMTYATLVNSRVKIIAADRTVRIHAIEL
jgi:hypothetical protein